MTINKDNIKAFFKSNLKWIITCFCMLVFLILAYVIIEQDIIIIDTYGYGFISKYLISDKITPLVRIFTNLGGTIWLICFSIVLSLITIFKDKNKKLGIIFFFNLCVSALINFTIKNILQRPRPLEEYRLISEKGFSFPSGHSMVSMAVYGFLIYRINKMTNRKSTKIISTVLLTILIMFIGISRIYLGVHYTSDVLAGFLLGITYLVIFTHFLKRMDIEK